MATKYRIKQYYTLNGGLDITPDFIEGYTKLFDRILDQFLSDYSLTRTAWETAEGPYDWNWKKCYINFGGKTNLFEIYFHWMEGDTIGAEMGFNSPGNTNDWPDGPTVGLSDHVVSGSWDDKCSFYLNVLEKYDDDGGDPPEVGELIGFSMPHDFNFNSTAPVIDPSYMTVGYFFFDTEKSIAYAIRGCYPTDPINNGYPSFDDWIFDYEHFLFKGRLSNKYKSFSSGSRCIVSQVMYEDEYYRTSSLDIPCLANVYNNSFQSKEGKTVHADREYAITSGMLGTCIAYDEFIQVPIPGQNPPNMNEGE